VASGPHRGSLLFFNLPASGHVNPTLPLVAELNRRGHRVIYYTGDRFRTQVERHGAEFRSYGEHLTYDHSRLPENLLRTAAVIARATEDLLPFAIAEVRRERPPVVICDSMCPWGRLAARALGAPGIASLSTLALDPRTFRESTSPAELLRGAAGGALGYLGFRRAAIRLRRRYGVDLGGLFDLFVYRDRVTIVYTTRGFQPHAESFDESVRFVGPLLREAECSDDDLLRRLDGPPLIYVSLGTVSAPDVRFFRACIEAVAGMNHTLLLAVGAELDPATLGPVPSNCLVRQSVPQVAVLRRAKLFITHGGMNSTSEGLALGVPLLVYPQQAEQAVIARRVVELGAGRMIRDRDATPNGIRDAIEAVMAGSYREGARSVARSFEHAGGAAAAADAVEELIGRSDAR
jgi:MGT family glycosyltransferase